MAYLSSLWLPKSNKSYHITSWLSSVTQLQLSRSSWQGGTCYGHTHTRLTAPFPGLSGSAGFRPVLIKQTPVLKKIWTLQPYAVWCRSPSPEPVYNHEGKHTNTGFYWSKRQWVVVASAGPYASLHVTPYRQPRQHPTTQFFTDRMPFLPPNQQRQSTEGIVNMLVIFTPYSINIMTNKTINSVRH